MPQQTHKHKNLEKLSIAYLAKIVYFFDLFKKNSYLCWVYACANFVYFRLTANNNGTYLYLICLVHDL